MPPPTHYSGWRRRARLAAGLVGADPPTAASFASGGLVAATRELVGSGRFDVVHVTHFEAGFLGRELDGQPRVFVPIDTWSLNEWERVRATHGVPRLRDRIERVGIERFERRSLRDFPVTVVVSEADRQALRSLVPSADVRVIPNGVDSGWFAPVAAAAQRWSTPVVVFHGSLHYEPNVDAAIFLVREIMPLVREQVGPVDVRLVGRRPVPEVLELAAPDVTIHADVPDLRPLVGDATVAVIPLRYGSGVKNKVLEAVALGVPTVVTPQAVAGLDLVEGEELLVAEGAGPLADAIVRLLTDEASADDSRPTDAARSSNVGAGTLQRVRSRRSTRTSPRLTSADEDLLALAQLPVTEGGASGRCSVGLLRGLRGHGLDVIALAARHPSQDAFPDPPPEDKVEVIRVPASA